MDKVVAFLRQAKKIDVKAIDHLGDIRIDYRNGIIGDVVSNGKTHDDVKIPNGEYKFVKEESGKLVFEPTFSPHNIMVHISKSTALKHQIDEASELKKEMKSMATLYNNAKGYDSFHSENSAAIEKLRQKLIKHLPLRDWFIKNVEDRN